MFKRRATVTLTTKRMILRLPQMRDHGAWVGLREQSAEFLRPWEPVRTTDQTSRKAFQNRVYWAEQGLTEGRALALLMFAREGDALLGSITLDNIRRGPAQSGTLGYWTGAPHARQGYMAEAIEALVQYAHRTMDISRVEAACLRENKASRALLEKSGFKYEGVAQSYLQIAGRWRTHVLYAALRYDRRGRTDADQG